MLNHVHLALGPVPPICRCAYCGALDLPWFAAAHDFAGTCGLLDTGRACSKAQYVKFTLFSPFVFACLAAVSVGWLIVVAIATWKYARLRKRREGT